MDSDTFFNELKPRLARLQAERGITKRSALRMSIANLTSEGVLSAGDRLPSEREMAEKSGFSLGTVQAALSQLRDLGFVSRRRGDGTVVNSKKEFDSRARHFRLRSRETGLPVRVTDSRTRVVSVSDQGPWTSFLGSEAGILAIQRWLVMNGNIPVYAEMYVDKQRCTEFEDMNPTDLDFVNIRVMLRKKFEAPHTVLQNRLKSEFVPQKAAEEYGLALSGYYFKVSSWAETPDGVPMYYQEFLVDMSSCDLEF
ncbi:GntR family transcriptional regulator [Ruegeria sp. Ofav3-42]|uniref:GntR family transcriptional regulator n=1 Tax=Ruegeria sp. Ofav3-42 TaxID=2917759 RepID=UPI001EF49167|nr:GntR family transcriptional regulator [Ruegeria sp. Ofav3-42]MCG7521959.1 GntR family transcriptional regulator [Ruegeria sp. Ofav3-42]